MPEYDWKFAERVGILCDDGECELTSTGRLNENIESALVQNNVIPPSSLCLINTEREEFDIDIDSKGIVSLEGSFFVDMGKGAMAWGLLDIQGRKVSGEDIELLHMDIDIDEDDLKKIKRSCIQ